MAREKKIVTIGQLKYRKRLNDKIMKQLIESSEAEGIHLSRTQLLQKQKDILKKVSEDHAMRIKQGKNHAKLMKEENKPEL